MKTRTFGTACLALACLLVVSSSAQAGMTVALGGGWEAEVADLSAVSIQVDASCTPRTECNFIAIEIAKDFRLPPLPNGNFPGLDIIFRQIAADADTVPNIVILDESATNQTGTDWTDYHMTVGTSGVAWFDTVSSTGFSMSPFNNTMFMDPSNVFGGDPTRATDFWADGGVVPHNSSFFPGAGAGELVISVDLSGGAVQFTLTEFPTPEPATLALFGLGLIALRRRGR